jgi:cytochrome c553
MATGIKAALLLIATLAGLGGCRAARRAEAPPPPQFERVVGSATGRAALISHGARLGIVLGCTGCHDADLTGHIWSDDPRQAILYSSNLSRALPRYSDAGLARAIRFGVRPDGSELWIMPSQIFTRLSAPDLAALIAWLRTRPPAGADHPRVAIGPLGRAMIERGEIETSAALARRSRNVSPPRLDGRHDWARYLTRSTCAECHGLDLAGRQIIGENERAPDLAIAAGYSRAQFRHLLRTGMPVGGRTLPLMGPIARDRFAHLTDREVDAIYDYLVARAAAAR